MIYLFFGTGAIHFFRKMDIGPLKMGDFLGMLIITRHPHILSSILLSLRIAFLPVFSLFWFGCSNRSDIFCNRFCLHLAGTYANEAVVLKQFKKEIILILCSVRAGAQSGRDTFAIQSGFRGRGGK